MKINYKSDFPLLIRVIDHEGEVLPFPDVDVTVVLTTNGYSNYRCWIKNGEGVCLEAIPEGLLLIADSHCLSPGTLGLKLLLDIPNNKYPDGSQHIEVPVTTDIALSREASDCTDLATVDVHIPQFDAYPDGELGSLIPIATEEDIDKAFEEIFNTQK